MNVVVVGAGLMGTQIGCEYALGGHDVALVARRPDEAARRVQSAFELVRALDLADQPTIDDAAARTSVVGDLNDIDEGDLVVESVVEELEAKQTVLRLAADRFPLAILASNTSSLSITAIGAGAGAPSRTMGTHYWNPPLLMPLVEVIRGAETGADVVDQMASILEGLGKRPVRVEMDVPGFVWNRLQLALLREAVWIVENGVAGPETVDEIVRDGLARRWRLTGPFETVALGGAETFTRIAANLFPVLSDAGTMENVGRWLRQGTDELTEIRRRRDSGLVEELQREISPD